MSGRRIGIGEITLYAVEQGPADGRPILLLHGFPETHHAWWRQTASLAAQGYRVIVPDLRGYGRSDAPEGIGAYRLDRLADDVVALADACGAERFDLVGHDWGGVIAWAVAARHPARVRHLVAMAAPHPGMFGRALRRDPKQMLRSAYMAFFQLPWLPEALLSAGDFRLLKRSLVKTSRPGTFGAALLADYARGWRGRLTAMLDYYRAPRRPAIGRIGAPTLILWGADDRFLGVALAEESAAMCDQARVAVHGRATHWLHHEEAAWVTAEIAGFCEKTAV